MIYMLLVVDFFTHQFIILLRGANMMNKMKIVLACTLITLTMLLNAACSKNTVQPANTTSEKTSAAASATNAEVSSDTTAATTGTSDNSESDEKRRQDNLAMIREKIKNLTDVNGLVNVKDVDDSILIDLKYATTNNFTKKKIYPADVCVLQKDTAAKLSAANMEFKRMGYRIKIWDAYRPLYVQKIFWDIVQDDRFVANPVGGGSIHNHGCAVDLTLVDKNGKELAMPTGFDDFTDKAAGFDSDLTGDVKENVKTLRTVMTEFDFTPISTEWWHFEDNESSKYPVLDVHLDKFTK